MFFVNLFSYRYSIRSPEKRERIDRRRLSPKILGDKGSRVKNPRGSRHCVPAIHVAFISTIHSLNGHLPDEAGKAC